jgi:hypothetical protein
LRCLPHHLEIGAWTRKVILGDQGIGSSTDAEAIRTRVWIRLNGGQDMRTTCVPPTMYLVADEEGTFVAPSTHAYWGSSVLSSETLRDPGGCDAAALAAASAVVPPSSTIAQVAAPGLCSFGLSVRQVVNETSNGSQVQVLLAVSGRTTLPPASEVRHMERGHSVLGTCR